MTVFGAPADVQRSLAVRSDTELTQLLADVSVAVALRRDVPPHQVLREAEAAYAWPESDWPKVREHVNGWLARKPSPSPEACETYAARDPEMIGSPCVVCGFPAVSHMRSKGAR